MPVTSPGRFSDASFLILASLAGGPKHGYAIMEDIHAFSGTQLEPGTLYGAITRLEQKGMIVALESTDRRRPYQITAEGAKVLEEQVSVLSKVADAGMKRLKSMEARG